MSKSLDLIANTPTSAADPTSPSNASRRRTLIQMSALASVGVSSFVSPWAIRQAAAQAPVTVGMIYVGPRDDFGYNQAHAAAATELKAMPGVKVVEEENVPETK